MPRFYFDVHDGETFLEDEDGLEFPDIDAATDDATRALTELAKEVLPGAALREMAIDVQDHAREPLLRAVLRFEVKRLR